MRLRRDCNFLSKIVLVGCHFLYMHMNTCENTCITYSLVEAASTQKLYFLKMKIKICLK